MGKIYCMMGKSSTGKDTLYKMLLEDGALSLKKIIPYTTRPMRRGETDGVEYYFCGEKEPVSYTHLNLCMYLSGNCDDKDCEGNDVDEMCIRDRYYFDIFHHGTLSMFVL